MAKNNHKKQTNKKTNRKATPQNSRRPKQKQKCVKEMKSMILKFQKTLIEIRR